MTRIEHLLTIFAEECNETAQRATKALRFGLSDVQPEQTLTNAERLLGEYSHIVCAIAMLRREGVLPAVDIHGMAELKRIQVEHFLEYSQSIGTLFESSTIKQPLPVQPCPRCNGKKRIYTHREDMIHYETDSECPEFHFDSIPCPECCGESLPTSLEAQ